MARFILLSKGLDPVLGSGEDDMDWLHSAVNKHKDLQHDTYVLNSKVYAGKTTEGIRELASLLFKEVEDYLVGLSSGPPLKFTIIAHSLGGLITRYLLGLLYMKGYFDLENDKPGVIRKLIPVSYFTMATPHAGIDFHTKLQRDHLYSIFYIVKKKFAQYWWKGKTMQELYLEDGPNPLILALSDPDSIFFKALSLFPCKTLVSNATFDFQVDYMSSALTFTYPCGGRSSVVGLDVADVTAGHFRKDSSITASRVTFGIEDYDRKGSLSSSSSSVYSSCSEPVPRSSSLQSDEANGSIPLHSFGKMSRHQVYCEDEDDGFALSPNQSWQSLTAYSNSCTNGSATSDGVPSTVERLTSSVFSSSMWAAKTALWAPWYALSAVASFEPSSMIHSVVDKTTHVLKFPFDQLNFGRTRREILFSGFEEWEEAYIKHLNELNAIRVEFKLPKSDELNCERTPKAKRDIITSMNKMPWRRIDVDFKSLWCHDYYIMKPTLFFEFICDSQPAVPVLNAFLDLIAADYDSFENHSINRASRTKKNSLKSKKNPIGPTKGTENHSSSQKSRISKSSGFNDIHGHETIVTGNSEKSEYSAGALSNQGLIAT
eukprot:Nk52_evm11s276 gene=Nk52_evmTU11s276